MHTFAVILTVGFVSLGVLAAGKPTQAAYPQELVVNGSFEASPATTGWNGNTQVIGPGPVGTEWHAGSAGAYFASTNPEFGLNLATKNNIPLPSTATSLTFSMWVQFYSNEPDDTTFDSFRIQVRDADTGTTLFSKIYEPKAPPPNGETGPIWTLETADLTPYASQNVSISFYFFEDESPQSFAYVDDVSIIAHYADATAPTTALQSTPAVPNGGNGYFTTVPSIALTATDDPQGSGVATTYYRWDSDAYTVYAGALTPGQGTHTLAFYSIDRDGNVEPPSLATFKVDAVKPSVNAAFLNAIPDGSNGWYKTAPTISLAASDAVSGVASVQYRWNDGFATASTGVVAAPEGVNVLHFWATDVAGNVGQEGTLTVKVDATDPAMVVVGGLEPLTVNAAKAVIVGTVSDAGSGVSAVTVNGVSVPLALGNRFEQSADLAPGTNVFTIAVTDLAGRTKMVTKTIIYQPIQVLGTTAKVPVITLIRRNVHVATTKKTVRQKFTIAGENFSNNAKVWIGKVKPLKTVYKNSKTIVVVVPLKKLRAGTHNVTVKNPDGLTATLKRGVTITRS